MNTTLAEVLTALGTPYKPRYSVEEVAEILGIRRDQLIDLLRKGKLVGMRSSMNRWRCVFATELDAFIQKVNAPRQAMKRGTDSPLDRTVPMTQAKVVNPSLPPDNGLPIIFPVTSSPVRTGRRDLDI